MDNKEKTLNILSKLVALSDSESYYLRSEDFVKIFQSITDAIAVIRKESKDTSTETLDAVDTIVQEALGSFEEIKKSIKESLSGNEKANKETNKVLESKFTETVKAIRKEMEDFKSSVKNGENGLDGLDADEEKIVKKVLKQIPKSKIMSAEDFVAKINELSTEDDENKIDASHIKGIKDFLTKHTGLLGNNNSIFGIKELIAGTGISIDQNNLGYPVISATGASINVILVTYIQLVNLIISNGLDEGTWYLITDYQTISVVEGQTLATSFGAQEPLMVLATSDYTLAKYAWSPTYFNDIIEYEWLDQTSANPHVLIPNGNMGRIIYRESTDESDNKSNYYDFRAVLNYRPQSQYNMTGVSFPITISSIDNLFVLFPFTTFADVAELVAFFDDPLNGLEDCAYQDSADKFHIFSLTGTEWGDMHIVDSGSNPVTITASVQKDYYYTYGNTLDFSGGTFIPASDGNSRADNIHVGVTSDNWQGQVLNGVIFGSRCSNIRVDEEVVKGFFGNNTYNCEVHRDNWGFVVKERSSQITLGTQTTAYYYQTFIGANNSSIVAEEGQYYGFVTPDRAFNWKIGQNIGYYGFNLMDFRTVKTLNDRRVEVGYSNMDIDTSVVYSLGSGQLFLENWVGVANLIGTAGRIDFITANFPYSLFEVTIKPKLAEVTFTSFVSFFYGQILTGVVTGAICQVVNQYFVGGNPVYEIITLNNVDLTGETDFNDGILNRTIDTLDKAQKFTLEPLTCLPSFGGNVVIDGSGGIITLDGQTGDSWSFDNNHYDQHNVYQTKVRNWVL